MEDSFGKRLEVLMTEKGFSKGSLAKITKIHASTIKNWISNETFPDDLKLDIVIKTLGANRDYLFTGKGEKYSSESINDKKTSNFNSLPISDQMDLINKKLEYLMKSEELNRVYIKTLLAFHDIKIDMFESKENELDQIKKTVN